MKTLIKNGLLYDGSGENPYHANILIQDKHIVEISKNEELSADCILDAIGKVVTPGFVDVHRHCDIAVLEDYRFGELELAQGITTAIGGNCGLASFPSTDKFRTELCNFIEPCLGRAEKNQTYYAFADYINAVKEAAPRINIGSLIGIGAVKTAIKGYENTPFSANEMKLATEYITSGMEQGAFGISMGIMYTPECFSSRDEMVMLANAASKQNGILSCHIRGEGNSLVSSVIEAIEISERASIPLNISHFKATGLSNLNSTIYRAIEVIDKARARGLPITVDFYPYTAGATTLFSLLPPEYLKKDSDETLASLMQNQTRDKLKADLNKKHDNWDNMVESIGFERVILNSMSKESNKDIVGKSLADAATARGYTDIVQFVCDLLIDENGKIGIILQSMTQDDVDAVAKLPYSALISDSLYGKTDMPHPRLYGTTARFLSNYVLKRKVLDFKTAIHKMTKLPAERFGISGRGSLAVSQYADINIFSPNLFFDAATFATPTLLCKGMDTTLINGQIAMQNGRISAPTVGQAIIKGM